MNRLPRLQGWLDHLISWGGNGLLLGPIFTSSSHGYDTIDYVQIDPRLGDDADFDALVAACTDRGVRLLIDGVFSHAGRGFPPVAQALADRGLRIGYPSPPNRLAKLWFRPPFRPPSMVVLVCSLVFTAVRIPFG